MHHIVKTFIGKLPDRKNLESKGQNQALTKTNKQKKHTERNSEI